MNGNHQQFIDEYQKVKQKKQELEAKKIEAEKTLSEAKGKRLIEKYTTKLSEVQNQLNVVSKKYQRMMEEVVRKASKHLEYQHVCTCNVRNIEQGIQDAERIHKAQQEREAKILVEAKQSLQDHKDFVAALQEIIKGK